MSLCDIVDEPTSSVSVLVIIHCALWRRFCPSVVGPVSSDCNEAIHGIWKGR